MRTLLAILAAMVLLIAMLILSNRSLQHDLNNASQQRDALMSQLQQREQLIATLNQQMRQREQAELSLRQNLSAARQVMQTREQQRQRSLHENLQTRQWADNGLPADISRLHQRPAFSSASDYLHWLSGGELLSDTGQSPRH
ncbi:phage lysis regulatory protein [Rahnella aquatilis CIP 78.65 = ATCC 33071]|uniref:Phage lysis regulatory protein, LysB family n=1 Tax=Rahnella aquatilis (strain ATCC 33071 / DSM 4594 / JCM 1683 / NBRC 105701 / NCIMB 13365 / CIP 78.65) TaxID=745277 RepID=H2IVE1_RAHAC|nr:Rz-like lysis system protein LysB [Rahnella aquatilis]AEX50670.1 phage lysis regulatory protein, LysB family [Rahnella aquatilis CIP 78.65 = ATCC 33071]KFD01657.1 phage lysis regulatory protein [Rahnella aquatilis CIP 78.65 = ATCC 33071]